MSAAARSAGRLLRCYPPSWRARYGEELEALIVETSGRRIPWRVRTDVALGGARERLRESVLLGRGEPGARARGGLVLVLWAWALFVIGGAGLQKASEHWQDAARQGLAGAGGDLASAAFAVLVGGAVLAAVLVAAGIVAAVPAFLRSGGLAAVAAPLVRALILSVLAGAATVALVAWAHPLDPAERNGADGAYAAGFLAWAALCAACLLGWTAVASAAARVTRLAPAMLRAQARLAAAVAAAMTIVTAAAVVWWVALSSRAPGFLGGAELAAPVLMGAATLLAGAGARRALEASPAD